MYPLPIVQKCDGYEQVSRGWRGGNEVRQGTAQKLIAKSDFSLSLKLWYVSRHQTPIPPGLEPQCQEAVQGIKLTDNCSKFNWLVDLFVWFSPKNKVTERKDDIFYAATFFKL